MYIYIYLINYIYAKLFGRVVENNWTLQNNVI